MLRTLKAKLYPNATQARRLTEYLDTARHIFNRCLEARRDAWRDEKKSISRYDQTKSLTTWRASDPKLRGIPVRIERDAVHRVDLAFQRFFRRIKEHANKPGYPRFKSANRYNSIGIAQCGNVVRDGRIRVSGIAKPIRCRGLQPVVGTIKSLRIVRRAGKWFARILVDDGKDAPPKIPVVKAIGIDLGLTNFLVTSDGTKVGAPRIFRKLASRLRHANKVVSRRHKGSARRRKAVIRLQRVHARIADSRDDFTHKLSKYLVSKYELIAAEKLNIKGMVHSTLAKSIMDAGWAGFLWKLSYKLETLGRTFIQVNPAYTTQRCSRCGAIVPKKLSERVHSCSCGLVLDRDWNSAINILQLAIDSQHPLAAGKRLVRGGPLRPVACTGAGGAVETNSPN